MLNKNELVVNSSYKDFFLNPNTMRRDAFIFPKIDELKSMENATLTRSLALLLKEIDENKSAKYGIEIKTNGSERSSRIPLVRISESTQSLWKVSSGITSVEKAVVVLNELSYFLKEHSNAQYGVPKKVLVLKEDESLFANTDSNYYEFVKNLVDTNDIILFSFDYLEKKVRDKEIIDFDSMLLDKKVKIFTK